MFTNNPFKEYRKEVLDEAVSRKHFQQVADVIKSHPDLAKRQELAKHHADIFATQNPRFDHGRFYDACNAKGHVKDIKEDSELDEATLGGAKYKGKENPNINHSIKQVKQAMDDHNNKASVLDKRAEAEYPWTKTSIRNPAQKNLSQDYIAKTKKKSYKHITAANIAQSMLDKKE